MLERLPGYAADVFAAVWHDPKYDRGRHAATELPGLHDVMILAKYASGAKPVSHVELLEHGTLGMGQWRDFGRIAIVTDERWMRHAVQFFAPFFHGPVRVFSKAQERDARIWLESHDHH